MLTVDLHTHTTASDGTYTPTELVDYAVSKGIKAIAITDHDTMDGVSEALLRAQYHQALGVDFEIIPGVEFSTDYHGKDVHIVGLFLDYKNEYLLNKLSSYRAGRDDRNIKMCQKLRDHGIDITLEKLKADYPGAVLTRAHFAKYLLNHGYVSSVKEAFDRYVGDFAPCYVQRHNISPFMAVELIRKLGGFPILAHPVSYKMSSGSLISLVKKLTYCGLLGIEAVYSSNTGADERAFRTLAGKYNLAVSGGSDFHGENKPGLDLGTGYGSLFIPEEILTNIKMRHAESISGKFKNAIGLFEFRGSQKILFTDLDGTLLDSTKNISDYTFNILKNWTEAGNYLVLCSGRDINSVIRVYNDIRLSSLKNIYLIGYNGGQIYDPQAKETIYRIGIPFDIVNHIEIEALKMGMHIHSYTDDNIIAHYQSEELTYYQHAIKTPVIFSDRLSDAMTLPPCKILSIELNSHEIQEEFREALLPYAKETNLTLLYSNPKYLEIFPKESGKGASIKKLIELMEKPELITVAAGDQENDLSMLEASEISIGMVNGIDIIKDKATLVTEYDNDHNGLAQILEDLL